MISDVTLSAEPRTKIGSTESRRMRREGIVPVSVYSGGQDAVSVQVNARQLAALLRSEEKRSSIFYLDIAGKGKTPVRIKNLQLHPVRGNVIHADFLWVDLAVKVKVQVPIRLVGDAEGVKLGGILDHGVREVSVECLPADIPAHIDVTVTKLKIGDQLFASDLVLPNGVRLLSDSHQKVAVVSAARAQ